MPTRTIEAYEHECLRCGSIWRSFISAPQTCGNQRCRSPYWGEERGSTTMKDTPTVVYTPPQDTTVKEEPRTVKPDQIIEQKEAVAEKRERRSRFAEPETEPMVMAALKIAPVSPPRPVSVQPDPLICPSCKREPRAERIDVPGKLSVRCYPCSFEEARMSRIRGTREGFLEMLGLREGYSFDR